MTEVMFQTMGEFVAEVTYIANKVAGTRKVTEQMCQPVFIPIPKTQETPECNKHRAGDAASQANRVMLRDTTNKLSSMIK